MVPLRTEHFPADDGVHLPERDIPFPAGGAGAIFADLPCFLLRWLAGVLKQRRFPRFVAADIDRLSASSER